MQTRSLVCPSVRSASSPALKVRSGCHGWPVWRRRSTWSSPRSQSAQPTRLTHGIVDERDRRRSSRRRDRVRRTRRCGERTAPENQRAHATSWARQPINAPLFAAARATAQKIKPHSTRATDGHRGDRSRHQAAIRRKGRARETRTLPGVRCVPSRQGADPRVLRRARGQQDSRDCRATSNASPVQRGRHRRRGHDGRRHRDGLRERRTRRAAPRRLAARRSIAGSPRSVATTRSRSSAGASRRTGRRTPRPHPSPSSTSRDSTRRDVIIEAVFEDLTLKQEVFGALDQVAQPGRRPGTNTSTLDIDAIASATRAAGGGRRPALLQPRQRDAAARNRPRRGHVAQTSRDLARALRSARQGRRGRRERAGLRRQPDDVPVHVRNAVHGRGGRDARAGRRGADRLRHGDGHVRRRRHGRARRRRRVRAGARTLRRARSAASAGRRRAGRAGAVRPEDREGLVPSTATTASRNRIPRSST